jgi:hypothetical protein
MEGEVEPETGEIEIETEWTEIGCVSETQIEIARVRDLRV